MAAARGWTTTHRHSAARVAELGLPADGPRGVLPGGWGSPLRAAGWPVGEAVVDLPQTHGRGWGAGTPVAPAPQPVGTAPVRWLKALAADLGVPLAECCRGRLGESG